MDKEGFKEGYALVWHMTGPDSFNRHTWGNGELWKIISLVGHKSSVTSAVSVSCLSGHKTEKC